MNPGKSQCSFVPRWYLLICFFMQKFVISINITKWTDTDLIASNICTDCGHRCSMDNDETNSTQFAGGPNVLRFNKKGVFWELFEEKTDEIDFNVDDLELESEINSTLPGKVTSSKNGNDGEHATIIDD